MIATNQLGVEKETREPNDWSSENRLHHWLKRRGYPDETSWCSHEFSLDIFLRLSGYPMIFNVYCKVIQIDEVHDIQGHHGRLLQKERAIMLQEHEVPS